MTGWLRVLLIAGALVVMALVATVMVNMAMNVIGYPVNVKFNAKNGYVNRKFMQTTPTRQAKNPYR